MNPAMIERLKAVENQAEAMGRGARSAYLKQQAQELGISLATLYRKLEAVSVKPTHKRRSDAGKTELKPEEAKLISAVLVEAMRRNGKRLMSVRQAVEMLRANGKIEAARIDGETGEVIPLSENTITRALREYKLHPDQLLQPDPVSRMKSEHPNHCWQIDPSLCVLYYLPRQGKDTGLRVMKEEEFYKNKPKNVGSSNFSSIFISFYPLSCGKSTSLSSFPLSADYTHSNITPASFICNTVLLLSASSPSNSLSNAATLTGCFASTASIKP